MRDGEAVLPAWWQWCLGVVALWRTPTTRLPARPQRQRGSYVTEGPKIFRNFEIGVDPQTLRPSDPQTLRPSDPQTLRPSDPQTLSRSFTVGKYQSRKYGLTPSSRSARAGTS